MPLPLLLISSTFTFIYSRTFYFIWSYSSTSEKELAEKVPKLKQLLALAHNHINEHKKKLSDKQVWANFIYATGTNSTQADVFEAKKEQFRLNEELEKLKADKAKYSEQNFLQLQKNYEQNYRTSKHRVESLVFQAFLAFQLIVILGATTEINDKGLKHFA